MADNSSRKNLKRSLSEDEDSNKQPVEKRVRFPQGKKSKPEQVLEEEARVRQDPRAAARERARIRNQSNAEIFIEDDEDGIAPEEESRVRQEARAAARERARIRNRFITQLFIEDNGIAGAEETYEDDGNRTEDGIQIEAFNMDRDKEEGYFDDDGNFVEYVRDDKVQDAWLDSIENNPMYMGRSATKDTDIDEEDNGKEKPDDELSQDDIGVRKRRIANVLEPGETVLRALKRLKGNSDNRKEKMTSETKHIFDQLTEDADKLIQNGDYNVYHEKQDVFQREAEEYERLLAQAKANSESFEMFGDDEDTPDPSISGTQLNPDSTTAEAGALQQGYTNDGSDYVFDESSGYYYSSSLGYYYDPNTGLYCSATTGKWYKYDEEMEEYEEVVSEVASEKV